MIMREKHMRKKNWKHEKRIKFFEKMVMMGPEYMNLKAKNEKKNTLI